MSDCAYCGNYIDNPFGEIHVTRMDVVRVGMHTRRNIRIENKTFCNSICLSSYFRTYEEIHDKDDDDAMTAQEKQ